MYRMVSICCALKSGVFLTCTSSLTWCVPYRSWFYCSHTQTGLLIIHTSAFPSEDHLLFLRIGNCICHTLGLGSGAWYLSPANLHRLTELCGHVQLPTNTGRIQWHSSLSCLHSNLFKDLTTCLPHPQHWQLHCWCPLSLHCLQDSTSTISTPTWCDGACGVMLMTS